MKIKNGGEAILKKSGIRLEQVPLVAIEIFEHGNDAVGFVARGFEKSEVMGLHVMIVAPEIVRVEEQENAATGLIANRTSLLGCGSAGQEKSGAVGVRRSDDEPALIVAERRVSSISRKRRVWVKNASASSQSRTSKVT